MEQALKEKIMEHNDEEIANIDEAIAALMADENQPLRQVARTLNRILYSRGLAIGVMGSATLLGVMTNDFILSLGIPFGLASVYGITTEAINYVANGHKGMVSKHNKQQLQYFNHSKAIYSLMQEYLKRGDDALWEQVELVETLGVPYSSQNILASLPEYMASEEPYAEMVVEEMCDREQVIRKQMHNYLVTEIKDLVAEPMYPSIESSSLSDLINLYDNLRSKQGLQKVYHI